MNQIYFPFVTHSFFQGLKYVKYILKSTFNQKKTFNIVSYQCFYFDFDFFSFIS